MKAPRRIVGGSCSCNRIIKNMGLMTWLLSMLRITYCFITLTGSGAMIEAGSETTSQALNNTIVGLLSNPAAVRISHEELDRVVGEDRTPTFEDLPNLPYIWALVKV